MEKKDKGDINMILSVSRRTDIPSYYSEWFMNRLKAGYVLTRNPMNASQISRLKLSPEVIDCIVFWTKDPSPLMDKLTLIGEMGYRFYIQFTLTPYGRELEKNLRSKEEIIDTFIRLSQEIGKEKVLWRYDPIILNDLFTISYHREKFEELCNRLKDFTDICAISFVDLYPKLKHKINKIPNNSLSTHNLLREISDEEIQELAGILSEIGRQYGIELRACSERINLEPYGVRAASCIDQATIEKICGYPIDGKADKNQRPYCGCIQSIDIGVYNTCRNGCLYCYANHSDTSVDKNYRSHDPASEILIGTVNPYDKVTDKEMKLLKNDKK